MPVERFHSFEDARRALWVDGDDPELGRRIRDLWDFAARLAPGEPFRGLRKFLSLEEANEERERRTAARVERLRARRP